MTRLLLPRILLPKRQHQLQMRMPLMSLRTLLMQLSTATPEMILSRLRCMNM